MCVALPYRKGVYPWVWQYQTEGGCILGCGSTRQKKACILGRGSTRQKGGASVGVAVPDIDVCLWVWQYQREVCNPCVWHYQTEVCIRVCGITKQWYASVGVVVQERGVHAWA